MYCMQTVKYDYSRVQYSNFHIYIYKNYSVLFSDLKKNRYNSRQELLVYTRNISLQTNIAQNRASMN